MTLAPGDRLDRFRIEALLGSGGMGAVYRAYDERLQRRVALKVMLREERPEAEPAHGAAESESGAHGRLLREARAAAAITHPHAVAIYDVGEHEGVTYIAMELIDGATLRTWIGAPDVPLATKLRWLAQIAEALAAAHASGLVHRDVKPENVLIQRAPSDDGRGLGSVKVLDFGIARRLLAPASEGVIAPSPRARSEPPPRPDGLPVTPLAATDRGTLTNQGGTVGTPRYMAPEQVRAEAVDGRADQFAWGVVAYELLTGRYPWDEPGGTPLAFVEKLLSHEPPPLDRLTHEVPPAVSAVVARALGKASEDRYPSMRALSAALSSALAGTELAAHEARSTRAARDGTSRTRVAVAAGAVLLALGAAGAIVARVDLGRTSRPSAPAGSGSASAPSPSASAREDDPPPKTTPEALAAYEKGRKAHHQGAASLALSAMREAIRLDPSLAAAHLRVAQLSIDGDPEMARAAYAKAAAGRDALSPRDRAILDAETPLFARATPDLPAWAQAWRSLVEARPRDAEIAMGAARAAQVMGDIEGALGFYERALSVEPDHGEAHAYRVEMLAYLGRWSDAQRAVDECLARDPLATSCVAEHAWISRQQGDCAAMETDARRWIVMTPEAPRGYRALAQALAAEERPTPLVSEAIEQCAARAGTEPQKRVVRLRWTAGLQTRDGDFEGARKTLDALKTETRASADRSMHAAIADLSASIALEIGDARAAGEIAQDFLARREAWIGSIFPDDGNLALDPTGRMLAIQRDAGALDAQSFATKRDAWIAEWSGLRGAQRGNVWIAGFAELAHDRESALAALAKLPELGEPRGMVSYVRLMPFPGRARLLAGKSSDAVPLLRAAASACDQLHDPVTHQRATLWLGEALEATGDTAGACAAYATVERRWRAAKPRSVTAEAAQARRAALRCPRG
jgi:serine/threonine-protein kinase